MNDEENKPTQVVTIGAGTGLGKHNAGLFASQVIAREQQVRKAEVQKRRDFVAGLSDEYLNHDLLEKFEKLTTKELRKHSKDFCFIHMQIKSLGLARMAKTGRGISANSVKQVIAALSYISHSKQFCGMNMEDTTTDYFRLTMALYVASKALPEHFKTNNIPQQQLERFRFIASEIGIRIYTLYTDLRMDM